MKLDKIDLTNLIAIGHEDDTLSLLVDRGTEMEYIEVPAPQEAFRGLKQVSALVNEEIPAIEGDLNQLSGEEEPGIYRQQLQSSLAEAIEYDPEAETLQVEFLNGAVYEYEDVDEETWEEFCEAESPGKFYNAEIRGFYYSRRLE